MVAARVPAAEGLKLIVNVAEPGMEPLAAATIVGAPETVKSEALLPLIEMPDIVNAAVPLFSIVKVRLIGPVPKSVPSVEPGLLSPSVMLTDGLPPLMSISGVAAEVLKITTLF